MFVRPCWRPASETDALELIEENPWAFLVSNGPDGPSATNLPLLFDTNDRKRVPSRIPTRRSEIESLARSGKSMMSILRCALSPNATRKSW